MSRRLTEGQSAAVSAPRNLVPPLPTSHDRVRRSRASCLPATNSHARTAVVYDGVLGSWCGAESTSPIHSRSGNRACGLDDNA